MALFVPFGIFKVDSLSLEAFARGRPYVETPLDVGSIPE